MVVKEDKNEKDKKDEKDEEVEIKPKRLVIKTEEDETPETDIKTETEGVEKTEETEKKWRKVGVTLNTKEYELAEKMANVLYLKGLIEKPLVTQLFKYSVFKVVCPIVLKEIETERMEAQR